MRKQGLVIQRIRNGREYTVVQFQGFVRYQVCNYNIIFTLTSCLIKE